MKAVEKEIESVEAKVMWADIVTDFRTDAKQSNKRMFVIIMALLAALLFTNAYWIWTFNQYDYVTETSYIDQQADATDGGAAINNTGGDVTNGASKTENSDGSQIEDTQGWTEPGDNSSQAE